jgi:adenine/guanine/hypoxanthine permease
MLLPYLYFYTLLLTVILSIAYGVIVGIISYIFLNGTALFLSKISGGRIVPPGIEMSEEWVVPPGGIIPIWL